MDQQAAGMEGQVVEIFVAPEAGALMEAVSSIRAVPGRGLEGDRYFYQKGSFSRWPGSHREVTLISKESLEDMAEQSGIVLRPDESRRNIVTSGIDLNALLHRTFSVGPVHMQAVRLCQPCKYLARLSDNPDLVPAMLNRGGLRARILTEGVFSVGDCIIVEG